MSNEANTADKKIAGERTVKKKAGRNVVVSPVNVKASGKSAASKELTAPIGLVWNEDTAQAQKKQGKTVRKQPERPMITGTGWPDRPPAPKGGKPGPIQYKPSQTKKKETKAVEAAPVKKHEPFSSEEKLDALMSSVEKDQPTEDKNQPAVDKKQAAPEQKRPASGHDQPAQGQKQSASGQQPQGRRMPGGQRPNVNRQNVNGSMKQGSVLYSPVAQTEAVTPISPMQKRPVNTQVWEGPIRQVPGYGDQGYGPKFVRTVVTTTTTTYEPVTEDVIRQITSQTSPVALTENVLNQPPSMPPVPGQQTGNIRYPATGQQAPVRTGRPGQGQRPMAGRQQAAGGGRQMTARGGLQPVRQQVPGGRMQATGQIPDRQIPAAMQPVQGQGPGRKQSIIGTMESKGPAKPSTGMTSQLAEIEKALGLTGDSANAGNNALTEAIINNAGVTPPSTNAIGMDNKAVVPGQPNTPTENPGKPPLETGGESKRSMEYMMLFVEGIIFLIVLAICISIFMKIKNGNKRVDTTSDTALEETRDEPEEDSGDEGTEDFEVEEADSGDTLEGEGEGDLMDPESSEETTTAPSGSVDVDNDKFTLRCTNVTVKLDTDGNPAALIYFSFTNKTGEQKAIADVFPISVTQNGEPCDTFAALDEYPEEYYNKDMQISDGSELTCAYAVSLKDAVSPLVLTVHDNSSGELTDVGSTEIALQ